MNTVFPHIDIICSVYNPKPSLLDSLQSVLEQTYPHFSLILIDDGSTQKSALTLLKQAEQLDKRITVIKNTSNLGLTQRLYTAVEMSQADYIARIDSGDTWLPQKLETQYRYLQQHPNTILIGTQCSYIDASGKEIGRSWFAEKNNDILVSIKKRRGLFEHSSILFRRIINYRTAFKLSQDLDLYLRATTIGHLYCLPQPLTRCEMNISGLTIKKRYLQRKYQALAYRSYDHSQRNEEEVCLHIKTSRLEACCWKVAQPFYIRYVRTRTNKRSFLIWGSCLVATLLFYPPLIGDYWKKLFSIQSK